MRPFLFLLALPAFAQISLTTGTAADTYHTPTTMCAFAGTVATNPPCVTNYWDPTMNPQTLFYGYAGLPFSYSIPAPNGACDVSLIFAEPNKSAVGQRIFSVNVQGVLLPNIDVFAHVGLKMPYSVTIPAVKVTNGLIAINFQPIVGNAVISSISVNNCQGPFVDAITPTGAIDGVNASFALPSAPNPPSSLALYRNGLYQTQGADYALSALTITFVAPPMPGDRLTASWRQ